EAVQIILTWIDNDIYSTVDAYPNACEMWKAIERLKQGESINVQDLETNLYWEFRKFTSRDGESLESYYSRFYKMMNELVRNQCVVTNHQVNVQFLLQLQLEWQRFVTLVKQSQELKTVSYHKLYDILKQHQNEVNEIRAKRLARNANPLALVAQQQPDQEPSMVAKEDEMSKDKEIDKLMALISLSFKKIYKPTNNNLRSSSNTSKANQDNSPRINRGTGYDNQRTVNVAGARKNVGTPVVHKYRIQCYNCKEYGHVARECQKPKRAKDAAYQKEKMLLCKQEEAGFQLNAEQTDWKDDTDDESKDHELEAHYMYMAKLQEITPDAVDNSGPIYDTKPVQQVQNNDNYNVFSIKSEHPEQSQSIHDTYPIQQDEHNMIIDSLDMSYDREQANQYDANDLDNEHELLASLIEKLKSEINDNKNRNKFLETSNKALIDKLKGEIKDFKTKNKSLESSNNRFKEANNELSKTNELMYNDIKKFQKELDRHNDVKYALKVEIDCVKAKGDLISYKMESQKSFNVYTQKINDLNQTILEMKKELFAHQETISILTQQNEAQIKLYKSRKDKEIDKVIALENKVKVLDNIVYKTGQSVQTINMLNRVIPTTSVSRPQLKCNQLEDRVMRNNSQGKKQEVEEHRRSVKFSKNKTTREPKRIVNQSVAKPHSKTVDSESINQKPKNKIRKLYEHLMEIILFIIDSGCSKHMTGNLKLLINFVEKFLGTVKFRNDKIAPILGYGDLVKGKVMIKMVYYVEGLNHNLFSVGQFCDADLEVAFRKSTCYIQSINGKKYVLVIVDDYSKYTWTHFLRSKDETPEVLIDFLRLVQRGLHAEVRTV
nr:hypothetical protein [Tanacetum cinerariifolium]